jgi:hypothetical protein
VPRIALKTLLRDLKAAGVVRYRKSKDGIELVFGGYTPEPMDERVPEGEERQRHAAADKAGKQRDPLELGTEEFPAIEGEDEAELEN